MRYEEIDLARTAAIAMMIVFHTAFDLQFFSIYPVAATSGFWKIFALATASLFLFIAGISLVISREKSGTTGTAMAKKFVGRGLFILGCGLLVTFATFLYLGTGYVVFGILHLIGITTILSPLFFRFWKWNIAIGILMITGGWVISTLTGPAWLLPLGICPENFMSVDYTPILPWAGMMLIGMGAGEILYPCGKHRFALPLLPHSLGRVLTFPGRHSLVIYLVHQPMILLILSLLTGKVPL